MKAIQVMLLGAAVAGLAVHSKAGGTAAEQKPRAVTARELNEGTAVIIGELGVPLVTAVEIVATVEQEFSPYLETPGAQPIPSGNYLLRVEEIDGKKLKEPRALRFVLCHTINATVAPSEAELVEWLKTLPELQATFNPDGKYFVPDIRNAADAAAYKKRYVGSRHRLVVHEEARQNGVAANHPPDTAVWSVGLDHQRFETYLCVLAERKL